VALPTVTLTAVNVVFIAALVAAVAALISTLVSGLFLLLNERMRQKHSTSESDTAAKRARHERLRVAAADFAAVAVQEVEMVSQALKHPRLRKTLRAEMNAAHGELRSRYEGLLLLSESIPAQEAARLVLRTAWNEKADALGEPRRHARSVSDAPPAKELRRHLTPFLIEVRKELGMTEAVYDETNLEP
jgi:hypothetical protein